MKKKFRIFAGSILIIGSLGCFFYPNLRNWKMDQEVNLIAENMPRLPDTVKKENKDKDTVEYGELYSEMEEYNQRLALEGQQLLDAWSYEEPPVTLHHMADKNEAVGYIEIPDMQVRMPLFLGASKDHLAKGAGILSETSMPIGGKDTNCVIAAHRGWKGSPYFQYIENMKEGSYVYVNNLWETLVYEAVEIKIIDPFDLEAVLIQPGKDMVTLLSCHPYGRGGGTLRYLVYCEYVETREREKEESLPEREEVTFTEGEIVGDSRGFINMEYKLRIILPALTGALIFFICRLRNKK